MKKILPVFVMVAMWAGVALQSMYVFAVCAFLLSAYIVYSNAPKLRRAIPSLKNNVKVTSSANDIAIRFAKPIVKPSLIQKVKKLNTGLDEEIRIAGRAKNPRIMIERSAAYTVLSAIFAVPLAIILSLFYGIEFALIGAIPAAFLFYPKIANRFFASERKSSIGDELAFFSIYASVMQSVGKPLHDSLISVAGTKIFPVLEAESKILARNIRIFGMDPLSALNDLGITHPNLQFRNLLLGYVSVARSGGDLSRYMERKADEFFSAMKFKYSSYKNHAGTIGEMMLIALSIFPSLILVSSFMMPQEQVNLLLTLSFVVIPVIAVVMYLFTNMAQPRIYNKIGFSKISVIIGAAAGAAAAIGGLGAYFVVGAAVAVASLYNFAAIMRQFRNIAATESALPEFFRDITEYVKIGIDVQGAIIKLASARSYNSEFDSLVAQIAVGLKHGLPLLSVLDNIFIRSWIVRTAMFVLGKVAESGGGTADILEQITGFAVNVNQAKKETISSVQAVSYMGLFTPLMMAYMTKEVSAMMGKFNTVQNQQILATLNMQSFLPGPVFLENINLLTVIIAVCIGVVMSKLANFTLKHTLMIGISALVAVIAVIVMPYMPGVVN